MNGITWLGGDEYPAHRQVLAGDAAGADRGPGRLSPGLPGCALRWVRMDGCGASDRPDPGARRSWVDDAAAARSPEEPPTAPRPAPEPPTRPGAEAPDPYAPRRRYPWHDDPNYDPAAYRRPPGQWSPPPPAPPFPAYPGPGPAAPPGVDTTAPWPAASRATERAPHTTGTTARPAAEPTTRVGPAAPTPTPPRGEQTRAMPVRHAAPPTAAHPDPSAHPDTTPPLAGATAPARPPGAKLPRKLTVTRVAAMRGRQFAEGSVRAFHRAATADGADRSGLTALTYATMMTYAVDAAVAVALANTLFFAAATGGERHQRRPLPRDHRGAVRRGRAGDRAAARPRPARAARGAGPHLRPARRARRGDGVPVPHLAALPGRAGHAGAVEVVRRAQGGGHAPGAAPGDHAGHHELAPHHVRPGRGRRVRRDRRRASRGCGARRARWCSRRCSPSRAPCCACGSRSGSSRRRARCPRPCAPPDEGRRTPMGRSVVVALWGNGAIRVLTGFLTLFVAFVVKPDRRRAHPAAPAHRHRRRRGGHRRRSRGNAAGSRPRALSGVVVLWCVGAAVAGGGRGGGAARHRDGGGRRARRRRPRARWPRSAWTR